MNLNDTKFFFIFSYEISLVKIYLGKYNQNYGAEFSLWIES